MYSEYLHTYPDHQAIATPYLYVLFMLLMFGNLLEAPNTLPMKGIFVTKLESNKGK